VFTALDVLTMCFERGFVACQFSPFRGQLPATSFQLPATSYQLPATSYQLPASSFQLPVLNKPLILAH
jgi:hypothetical protein